MPDLYTYYNTNIITYIGPYHGTIINLGPYFWPAGGRYGYPVLKIKIINTYIYNYKTLLVLNKKTNSLSLIFFFFETCISKKLRTMVQKKILQKLFLKL